MRNTGQKEKRKDTDPLYSLRHSTAHVMAQAVGRLYGQIKLGIGPPIEDGFYYDFDVPEKLSNEDLPKIEAEMEKIIKEDLSFDHSEMTKDEARTFFGDRNDTFKLELIDGIKDEKVSIYRDGDFTDLCEGPHVPSTGRIPAFKLLSVAGAYWRGSEKNAQLQRIYGTAFYSKKDLKAYLYRLEEAKRRDHRKLGKELEFFSFEELAGPGVVFYHPKGALVRSLIEDYIKAAHLARDYELVSTPHIFKTDLWQQSGHLEHYKEFMFLFESEEQGFGLKPMNCPGHILIYRSRIRSYRELPLRYFEMGTVYRNEKSGVLHGLLRVRGFTQDDAHIFLREDQLVDEIANVIDFAFEVMKDFGFDDIEIELSTRPEKFIGDLKSWDHAENSLREALKSRNIDFAVHEGDGAFYGPKIDIKIKDAIGRSWQCGTIQCDFALPERFNLSYAGSDGATHRPIMVHRALLGSFERFFGMLIEHYAGALPMWLSPIQVMVIPIGDEPAVYGQKIVASLKEQGLRARIDIRNEKMQAKIRDAQLQQIPYMVIVGDREAQAEKVSIRHRRAGDLGVLKLEEFVHHIKEEQVSRQVAPPQWRGENPRAATSKKEGPS